MNYRKWTMAAAVVQILTGLIHSLSFFSSPSAANDTEKQLISLMTTYRKEMGLGFSPTMFDLFTALSACFALIYLFGGVLLIYLLRKQVDASLMKGVLNISILFFGVAFVVMAVLTFPPPIVLTGLSFVLLIVARFAVGRA